MFVGDAALNEDEIRLFEKLLARHPDSISYKSYFGKLKVGDVREHLSRLPKGTPLTTPLIDQCNTDVN